MEKKLFNKIALDIICILVLIFAFMNNPYRFSNKIIMKKLTYSIATFTLVFLIIIMMVLIIYCKILTIINIDDLFSLSIPFFIILVFSLTILIIIYINTDINSSGLCFKKYDVQPNDDDLICMEIKNINECEQNEKCKWNKKFISPPSYMLDRKFRTIIHLVSLILTLINLYIFLQYFNKNNNVMFSKLNKLLTSNLKVNKAQPLIISFFVITVLLYLILIFQQLLYQPCKLELPNNWDF